MGFLVNRGPQISAAFFGPATAAVLLLLWVMIVSATHYSSGGTATTSKALAGSDFSSLTKESGHPALRSPWK